MHLLMGFGTNIFRAYRAEGGPVSAWFQVARSKEKNEIPEGVETYLWKDMYVCNLPVAYYSELSPTVIRKVADLSYPYFIRSMDRAYVQALIDRGSWLDVVNQLHMMIHFFFGLFKRNRVSHLISCNIPHEGPHIIAYFLAKELGIRNIIITQSLFPDAFWILQDFEDYGFFKTGIKSLHQSISINRNPKTPFYMKSMPNLNPARHAFELAIQGAKLGYKAPMAALGFRKRAYKKGVSSIKSRQQWYGLHSGLRDAPREGERYIYFPLHYQPEMTTDVLGGRYCDQLAAIEELVRILPEDIALYAKENPMQTGVMRDSSFIKRIQRIPQVRYLSSHINSFELIRGATAIATITGTAGWEALQMGKPVICFGRAWYRTLPGVVSWSDNVSYESVINFKYDEAALQREVVSLSAYLRSGIVDADYEILKDGYDATENAFKVARSLLEFVKCVDQSELSLE